MAPPTILGFLREREKGVDMDIDKRYRRVWDSCIVVSSGSFSQRKILSRAGCYTTYESAGGSPLQPRVNWRTTRAHGRSSFCTKGTSALRSRGTGSTKSPTRISVPNVKYLYFLIRN